MFFRRLSPNYLVVLALALGLFSFAIAGLPSNVFHTFHTPPLSPPPTPKGHFKRGDSPSKDDQPYVPPHSRKGPPQVAVSGPQTSSTTGVYISRPAPQPGHGPAAPRPGGRGKAGYSSFRKSKLNRFGTVPPLDRPVSGDPPLQGAQTDQGEGFRNPPERSASQCPQDVPAPRILTVQHQKSLVGFGVSQATTSGGQSKWGFGDSDIEPLRSRTQTLVARRYQPHPGSRTFELINPRGRGGKKPVDPDIDFPRLPVHTATRAQSHPNSKESKPTDTGEQGGRKLLDSGRLPSLPVTRSPTRLMFELMNKGGRGQKSLVSLSQDLPKPRVLGAPRYQPYPGSKVFEMINSRSQGGEKPGDPAKNKKSTSTATTMFVTVPSLSPTLPQHAKAPSTGPGSSGASPLTDLHLKSRLHKWTSSSRRGERRDSPHKKRTLGISHSAVLARRTEIPSTGPNLPTTNSIQDLPHISRLHKWTSPDAQNVTSSGLEKQTPTSSAASSSAALPLHAMLASHPPENGSTSSLQDLPPSSRLHKWMAHGHRKGGRNFPHRKRTSTTSTIPSVSTSSKMNALNRLLLWELSSQSIHAPAYPYIPSPTPKSNLSTPNNRNPDKQPTEKVPKGELDSESELVVWQEAKQKRKVRAGGQGRLHTKRTSPVMGAAHLSAPFVSYNPYAPAPQPYVQSTYGEIDPMIWGLLLQRPANPAPRPVQQLYHRPNTQVQQLYQQPYTQVQQIHQQPYTQFQQIHQRLNTQVGGWATGQRMGGTVRATGVGGLGAQGGSWANLNQKHASITPGSTSTTSTSTPFSVTPRLSRHPFLGPAKIPNDHLPGRLTELPRLKLPTPEQISPMQIPRRLRVPPMQESRPKGKPPRPEKYPKARGGIKKKQRSRNEPLV
ncbi:hypothetical protein MMC30_002746 [Trapelia coarctata]|nr:hypothetical protein [Trapelia coarctata]